MWQPSISASVSFLEGSE
jgi:hypothetical protein